MNLRTSIAAISALLSLSVLLSACGDQSASNTASLYASSSDLVGRYLLVEKNGQLIVNPAINSVEMQITIADPQNLPGSSCGVLSAVPSVDEKTLYKDPFRSNSCVAIITAESAQNLEFLKESLQAGVQIDPVENQIPGHLSLNSGSIILEKLP